MLEGHTGMDYARGLIRLDYAVSRKAASNMYIYIYRVE